MYLCTAVKDLKEIIKYTFLYKGTAALVVVCNLLFVVFNLLSLVLFIPILQLIFSNPDSAVRPIPAPTMESLLDVGNYLKQSYEYHMAQWVQSDPKMALLGVCISVFLAFFLKNFFRYGAVWFQSELRMAVVRDLRNSLFNRALVLPLSYHSNERKGDLMARMNSDVGEIEIAVVSVLELLFREPIAVIINLITLILLSPELTLFSLFLLPVSAFVISRISKSLKKTAKLGQEQTGLLYAAIDEALNGIRIVKAFGAIRFVQSRFERINLIHQKLITKTFRKKDLAPLLNETIGALIMLLIVWFGGVLILDHRGVGLSGEVFLTFIIVFSQLLRPIQGISTSLSNLAKARVSLDRINEVLNQPEVILEEKDPTILTDFTNRLTFQNVSFSYQSDPILCDLNLEIKKGQTIALVGESGSGKSTLLDLIPRFYDPSSGALFIDGVNLKQFSIDSLRSKIGMVTQEPLLFNGSVLDNIAFGEDFPDLEKATRAAKIANAYSFIMALESGFDYNIGDRGNKLSGGQKQRISIARAIYKNPEILLLDEATSALDTESERLVQEALDEIMKGKTSIVVAHRLSTVVNADLILVMSKGVITEQGSHEQLLSKNGDYAHFCRLQGLK
ncbi:MAG: hypothetical protein RIQ90_693 [Bacteroidota bacterium]|jgi:subfamily B ATP-binding cassette protein MsbA